MNKREIKQQYRCLLSQASLAGLTSSHRYRLLLQVCEFANDNQLEIPDWVTQAKRIAAKQWILDAIEWEQRQRNPQVKQLTLKL